MQGYLFARAKGTSAKFEHTNTKKSTTKIVDCYVNLVIEKGGAPPPLDAGPDIASEDVRWPGRLDFPATALASPGAQRAGL